MLRDICYLLMTSGRKYGQRDGVFNWSMGSICMRLGVLRGGKAWPCCKEIHDGMGGFCVSGSNVQTI